MSGIYQFSWVTSGVNHSVDSTIWLIKSGYFPAFTLNLLCNIEYPNICLTIPSIIICDLFFFSSRMLMVVLADLLVGGSAVEAGW